MGGCFSCGSSSSSSFKNVRVVHLNGHVENYEETITVRQVITGMSNTNTDTNTTNPPKHFVCTALHLLSPSSSKPFMNEDTFLQPGLVYFMLPYSILQADVSPVDLASLAKRLSALAKAKTKPCTVDNKSSLGERREQFSVAYGGKRPCRVRPWKPILDTIREKSFNRRSESDLQEHDY